MLSESNEGGVGPSSGHERRKNPRYLVEIPLDYTEVDDGRASTGLTGNASEGGVMTFIGERIDVGAVLNITLFFRLGFSLTAMETKSEVIWRDDAWKDYLDNYKYGLRFLETEIWELEKLKKLLQDAEPQETLYVPTTRGGS